MPLLHLLYILRLHYWSAGRLEKVASQTGCSLAQGQQRERGPQGQSPTMILQVGVRGGHQPKSKDNLQKKERNKPDIAYPARNSLTTPNASQQQVRRQAMQL